MRDLSYEARLRSVGLPTLAYRRYRGDMIEMFKLTHGLYDTQAVEDFLDLKPSRARGHKYNVYKRGCRLNVRKFSFKLRVTDQWNNLPEHVVTATPGGGGGTPTNCHTGVCRSIGSILRGQFP